LSKAYNLPLVLHGRNAQDQMLDILKSEAPGQKGVFHCFSEDTEYAKRVFDLGYLISFTGVITFKNAHMLREVVKYAPLDKIMIETDCPYLAPQKFRGRRNEPSYVACVAEKIAEIKNISIEEVAARTTETAMKFFGIGEQRNTIEMPACRQAGNRNTIEIQ
ncbi:MAG: TatD family hydrolase, partial [Candidatus Margulisiibacteriota bacterium]